jgi:electron transport complex protein RnfC
MHDMNYYKERTEGLAIENLSLPEVAAIPLSQHTGKACKPVVKVKDRVLRGQVIAAPDAQGIGAAVHASLSGEVVAIKNMPHPVLGSCLAIQIKNDGKDETAQALRQKERSQVEIDKFSRAGLLGLISGAGIVGMGGAAFPTHIKLNPPKPVHTLILNGAECEPYLTSDYRLMLEKTQEIVSGLNLMVKILGVKKVYIAIEDNKPKAIEAFKHAVAATPYTVHILKTVYPQGGEKQLVRSILKEEVPSGGLPFDIGVVVQNVATAFAVHEAVVLCKPLYERIVTVCGSTLENPKNLRVRIGTPIRQLIEACGPVQKEIRKVVIGGPMMGIAQSSLEAPIIKSSGGVIAFSQDEAVPREDRVCCRCGRCIDICPVSIMPALIAMASEKERWLTAKSYDIFDCIECGLCSYVCPARRDLVQLIKYAKTRVRK